MAFMVNLLGNISWPESPGWMLGCAIIVAHPDSTLADYRLVGGVEARNNGFAAVDHVTDQGRNLVLPVVVFVDFFIETLTFGFVVETANPDVEVFLSVADVTGNDNHAFGD